MEETRADEFIQFMQKWLSQNIASGDYIKVKIEVEDKDNIRTAKLCIDREV